MYIIIISYIGPYENGNVKISNEPSAVVSSNHAPPTVVCMPIYFSFGQTLLKHVYKLLPIKILANVLFVYSSLSTRHRWIGFFCFFLWYQLCHKCYGKPQGGFVFKLSNLLKFLLPCKFGFPSQFKHTFAKYIYIIK